MDAVQITTPPVENGGSIRDGGMVTTPLLDAKKAAKALGVSPRTLWTLTRSGDVLHVRIGRRVLYAPGDLERFTESRRRADIPVTFRLTAEQLARRSSMR